MTTAGDDSEPRVDVADVRRRVQAVARATRDEGMMTPERAREILRDRARELAAIPTGATEVETPLQVISFTLAGERYAVDTRSVIEVFRLTDLTTLPGTEAPVLGLTAWRGRLLTILDLRAALGVPTTALNDMGFVIVLGADRAAFGVLADAMADVVTLAASEVRAPPAGIAAKQAAVRGVTSDALVVIDAAYLVREFVGETTQGERSA